MGFFIRVQARSAAPLVRLDLFRHPVIGLGFVSCALVTVVVMTTLVAGPFYLSGALGLTTMSIGLVMSVGPGVAALVGAPAGKLVDRFGGQRLSVGALSVMLLGTVVLPGAAEAWGVGGYAGALALITGGYAAFQAANNTTVMGCAAPDQRGLVSGLLNLSRNLGLITGASLMGAVFRHGTGVDHVASASAQALNQGVELTFMVAAGMVASAAVAAVLSGYLPRRRPPLKVQD